MVNRHISADIKECALGLWLKGWEIQEICEIFGVSRASLFRWRDVFEEHGSPVRPPSPLRGRPRLVLRAVIVEIHQLFGTDPDLYLDELALWLALHHDIVISIASLQRNLEDAGLTRKALQKIAAERDEALRAEFTGTIQDDTLFSGDGSEFVALDETSKNEHAYARTHGRSLPGQRAVLKDVFVQGDRYSLVAALTIDGYIAAQVVQGSFDSLEFYNFVQEQVLPLMNPYPLERSVLVLDNCRIHHNQPLADLINAAGCIILYLPPYSPDLNPIEESFSCVKAYIQRHGHIIRQEEDAIQALYEACGHITQEKAKGWFRHAGYIRG
ncbi:hypothetical protein NLJ89_g11811 [Agrocybe chaxingu]|uniref:Tc1-like transposase DDE domain-containing protein n=1 Tax=Agrocybe chaxingu TaxID=84603 RepID=A0A9W8JNN3_9AGAR|nr:hypothetical protein NLJ89_g11811 [Agrocybe chaxingu]